MPKETNRGEYSEKLRFRSKCFMLMELLFDDMDFGNGDQKIANEIFSFLFDKIGENTYYLAQYLTDENKKKLLRYAIEAQTNVNKGSATTKTKR